MLSKLKSFKTVFRKTQEDSYSYSTEDGNDSPKNIKFEHLYEIQKFGTCAIEEVIITLEVPTFLKEEYNELEITQLIKVTGFVNKEEVSCVDLNKEKVISLMEEYNSINLSGLEKTKTEGFEMFHVGENPLKYNPPENRTLYINCSNPTISCITINCKLSGLSNSTNTKLVLTMELQSSIFKCKKNINETVTTVIKFQCVYFLKLLKLIHSDQDGRERHNIVRFGRWNESNKI